VSDTNFDAQAYMAGLQTLLDRRSVAVTVTGFSYDEDFGRFAQGPIAELVIEGFETSSMGVPRQLAGTLRAGLLVSKRLTTPNAESEVFELALSVATALWDELAEDSEDDSISGDVPPVHAAGPINVTGIEPAQLDGTGRNANALANRLISYLVTFEQQWAIVRQVQPSDPAQPTTLLSARSPLTGDEEGDAGDYRQLVPMED
jgi:hypothetical protein